MTTIAFIGSGNMAGAIMGGLIEDGYQPDNIIASDPSEEKLAELKQRHGIQTTQNNIDAIKRSDVVVLAVKPQVMEQVLEPLKATLEETQPLLISVAAGINQYSLQQWAGDLAIVRCMPNTPSLVGKGASGLLANDKVSDQQKSITEDILGAVGLSVWVNNEQQLDWVTAVSGSGPAYYFLFMECMIQAAKNMGMDEEQAKKLTLQTALGAATMAQKSDVEPDQLRKNVTSPNGTTEQAILSFQNAGLDKIVKDAMEAVVKRSEEMVKELGAK
ncbi:pyrroline-5-carboxylate reductase [Bermanella marisrubri]|uniref:Pyrroline-5-carboxylate reductase n=1 Tax=Bermanella marisrubri TaxID=207949 RepID=Q1N4D2_9GAMM|nr:pyrroline-5-carboxylate reductase [Bermanella marisrubri]EAT12933.1 pyrroline-5-carboxylate reductase [Oceanobacter sp. RED65] [Bermanella marisrubri]QIZ82936.1 pyrroline-5-carboxylate reductase [Bermanella marisrubri]